MNNYLTKFTLKSILTKTGTRVIGTPRNSCKQNASGTCFHYILLFII